MAWKTARGRKRHTCRLRCSAFLQSSANFRWAMFRSIDRAWLSLPPEWHKTAYMQAGHAKEKGPRGLSGSMHRLLRASIEESIQER